MSQGETLRDHWWRPLSVLAGLLAVMLLGAGCVTPGGIYLEAGDCAREDGNGTFSRVDCADPAARFRVLEVSKAVRNACYDVPGVTRSMFEEQWNDMVYVCLGPTDVDPATAVNVAQKGDCLTAAGSSDTVSVQRIDCGSPKAVYQVLGVVDGISFGLSIEPDDCAEVPGTTLSYSWELKGVQPALGGARSQRVFCLTPTGVDPLASPDHAQAGDCLAYRDTYNQVTRIDCADPTARYRVLKRAESMIVDGNDACSGIAGVVNVIELETFGGYVLCLGSS